MFPKRSHPLGEPFFKEVKYGPARQKIIDSSGGKIAASFQFFRNYFLKLLSAGWWVHLIVVANDDHFFPPQQHRNDLAVRLRGLFEDDQVEETELRRQHLRYEFSGHDPDGEGIQKIGSAPIWASRLQELEQLVLGVVVFFGPVLCASPEHFRKLSILLNEASKLTAQAGRIEPLNRMTTSLFSDHLFESPSPNLFELCSVLYILLIHTWPEHSLF